MKLSGALAMFVVYAFLQGSTASAQKNPGLPPTPAPTAKNACHDGMTPSAQYGSMNFERLERKEIEARLQEIAGRAAADPRVRRHLACLMKR